MKLRFLISMLFFIFVCQERSFCQSKKLSPCEDTTCTSNWAAYTDTLYVSGVFSSCPIVVKYSKRLCIKNGIPKAELKITSIGWDVSDSTDCDTLTHRMYPHGILSSDIDVSFHNSILREINLQLSAADFIGFYNALDTLEKSDYYCNGGSKRVMYQSFEATCNSKLKCGYDSGIDPLGHHHYFWTLTNIPCNYNCCIIENSFCYDTTSHSVIGTENRYIRDNGSLCNTEYKPTALCGDWFNLPLINQLQSLCIDSCWGDDQPLSNTYIFPLKK